MRRQTLDSAVGSPEKLVLAVFFIALVGAPVIGFVAPIAVGHPAGSAVAAQTPANDKGATPLSMPAIAEAEISFDDVDPLETGSRMLRAEERHVPHHRDEAFVRRNSVRHSILTANAADLSRLCRLLL